MNYCESFCRTIQRMCNSAAPVEPYRIELTVNSANTNAQFRIYQTVSKSVEFDWGDGSKSSPTTVNSGTWFSHTYSAVGDYVITITPLTNVTDFSLVAYNADIGCFNPMNNVTMHSVYFPDGVTTVNYNIFYYWNKYVATTIVNYRLPDSVTTIGAKAFRDSGYNVPMLPANLVTIGDDGFYHNVQLPELTIQDKVATIGARAFQYCSNLANITFKGTTPPTIASNAFNDIKSNAVVYIPSGTLAAYTAAFAGTNLQNKTIIEQ